MAKQTITRLTDDLDGTEAAATVRFGWDGVAYEIDLTAEHAAAFAAAIQPYRDAARPVGPVRRGRGGRAAADGSRRARSAGELAAIRAWARGAGHPVADRGRIAATLIDAYHAAQQQDSPTGTEMSARLATTSAVRKTRTRKAVKKVPAKKTSAKKVASSRTAKRAAKKTPGRKRAANSGTGGRRS